MSELRNIPLDAINTEGRFRKHMGDLSDLIKSMRTLGQLQPILVNSTLKLVCGFRRLAAARDLCWPEITAIVSDDFDDLLTALKAERDENTCRKALTPSEIGEFTRPILKLERARAKERQKEAQARGRQTQRGVDSGKLPESNSSNGQTRDKVAEAVGLSGRTLEKINRVDEAAEADPEQCGPIKEEMNRTGNVDGAYKKLPAERKKAPSRKKSKSSAMPKTPYHGLELMYTEHDNPLTRTLEKLKALGKVSKKQFNAAIGDAQDQAWFNAIVSEAGKLPPMKVVEADGLVELVIDKELVDLCTLVRQKVIQAHDVVNRYNRFKFSIDCVKAAISDLYDVVVNGATVQGRGEK